METTSAQTPPPAPSAPAEETRPGRPAAGPQPPLPVSLARRAAARAVVLLSLSCWGLAAGQVPPGYPADYAATQSAGAREGRVVVYGATDIAAAQPVIDDFHARYPKVRVEYHEMTTVGVHRRFVAETSRGEPSADLLWSSAMDLQVKLVNDGYAQRYLSPEIVHLPDWAVWRHEAYGVTLEPVGIAYDRRRIAAGEVPRTRGELTALLERRRAEFVDRAITYDLEQAAIGFLFATQDEKASQQLWAIAEQLGALRVRGSDSSAQMLEDVAAGRSAIAYNVLGSYAVPALKRHPQLGFVYPRDYTLVGTRIAFISRRAAHPHAARLLLDHLLSRRGQGVLVQRSGFYAIRGDVEGETTASTLAREVGASLRPIAIQPSLMAYLDQAKRRDFLLRWQAALAAQPSAR